ncbi:MAG: hypothetical protein CMJ49_04490 [Planctomycetaceae bacterium]|nr:hypothetical protein [Planctomycetaceae bacterium]
MSNYTYECRDAHGQLVSGSIIADTIAEAGKLLRADGKFVVKLVQGRGKQVADSPVAAARSTGARGVRRDDVIDFAHQMSIMVETGVPISEALESVSSQCSSEAFKAVLVDVSETVQSGNSFSHALSRHPRIFPEVMGSMVAASEASGTMGEMLERISDYMGKERRAIKQVRGAMAYPMFMLVMSVGTALALLLFVLPRFTSIYASRGATLPLPTRILMGASELALTYWYVLVFLFVGSVVGYIWMSRTDWGRRLIDISKLRVPIIKTMYANFYTNRAMRTMGTMIGSGVPVLDVVQLTRRITQNVCYHEMWDQMDGSLRRGSQLSEPLFGSPMMPDSIARMIAAGEKAGRLGPVLDRVATFTEHEFDESVKRLTQFIEPAMIVIMGTMIGGVAISLLLPIFSISKLMTGG